MQYFESRDIKKAYPVSNSITYLYGRSLSLLLLTVKVLRHLPALLKGQDSILGMGVLMRKIRQLHVT